MKALTAALWLMTLILPAAAQAVNLNAPLSRQPTVGSEIDRGQEASFECGLKNLVDLLAFINCVDRSLLLNKQKATLSDPYEFGLYVRAFSTPTFRNIL
jgi:hypothetical protein